MKNKNFAYYAISLSLMLLSYSGELNSLQSAGIAHLNVSQFFKYKSAVKIDLAKYLLQIEYFALPTGLLVMKIL